MKYIHSLCLAMLTVFVLFFPAAGLAAERTVPILAVDGSGTSQAAPDQAFISLGVITQAVEAQTAQTKNASIANAIQNALIEIGIPEKCIQTRDYNLHPDYNRDQQNEITSYTVNNTVTVRVDDIRLIGRVIDTALANGANRVNSLNFDLRNTKQLRKEALGSAIKDAREKADIIAAGLGKTITGIQNVSENSGTIQPRRYDNMMLAKSTALESTPIEAGTIDFSATVHIEFILSN